MWKPPLPIPPIPQARLAQMERDLDRRLHEARQAGIQEGIASAQDSGCGGRQILGRACRQDVSELAELRPRLRRQAEADLVKLALAIARRILHRELAVDPAAMRGVIQAALEKIAVTGDLSRPDTPLPGGTSPVSGWSIARTRGTSSSKPIPRSIAAPPSSKPPAGPDASVESQLREIEQGLADRLESAFMNTD